MRPPSDEDIENYDEIMWSFIDMLQALLDWRKIIDLQSNGETVFRVTMSFPGLLGPSQEPDIQVVRSWDELPPLPEKHPPGYWRGVWEASQAEQQQPAEEAPPEPAEPGYWPVPPPNLAKRPSYPPPEDLLRLQPQPLSYMPSIEDLLRTGDTVLQSMAAIGSGAAAPWLGWNAMAASVDALDDFFRTAAPAKPADPSQPAASDSAGQTGGPIAAQPALAPAPGLFETLGNLAKGVVTAKLGPGDALGLAEAALYDAAFPNETKAFRSRVANGLASVAEEAEGVAAEFYNDALDEVQTGAALARYLPGPIGSFPGASEIPALIERAKIDIDPHLAPGADLADKTSAAIQAALQVASLGSAFAEGLAGRTIPLDPERPPSEPPPDERPAGDPPRERDLSAPLPPDEMPPEPPREPPPTEPPPDSKLPDAPSKPEPPGVWQQAKESMSARARDYQEQITGRRDQAYVVNGVKFDGVASGRYLEAKGSGYAKFVKNGAFKRWFTGNGLLRQARSQSGAAQGIPIEWHIADEEAVPVIQKFLNKNDVKGINVIFTPPTK